VLGTFVATYHLHALILSMHSFTDLLILASVNIHARFCYVLMEEGRVRYGFFYQYSAGYLR
jgi:hypothetical protein